MRPSIVAVCGLLLALVIPVTPGHAEELPLLSAGENEREDSGGLCDSQQFFVAGQVTMGPLRVGGDTTYCDAEWGFSVEFDLSSLSQGVAIESGSFVLRQIGYDTQSYTVGVFEYAATGGLVQLQRADLNPGTAVATFSSQIAPGPDLALDLTSVVQAAVDDGRSRLGLFVTAVDNQIGNDTIISFDGADGNAPPRLALGTATLRPNLVPVPLGPLLVDTESLSGGIIDTADWQLSNVGAGSAAAFRVGWYISTDFALTADDMLLTSFDVDGLATGVDSLIPPMALQLPQGLSRSRMYVGVIVDDLDSVLEENEEDNTLEAPLTIVSDLVPNTSLTLCGDSEREYSGGLCATDLHFLAGSATAGRLRIGGDTDLCDSEWGSSLEFDLGSLPPCTAVSVDSAVLVLRQRSRVGSRREIGVFDYTTEPSPTSLLRADLNAGTASTTFLPPAEEDSDLHVLVTTAVQGALNGGHSVLKLFLTNTVDATSTHSLVELDGCDGLLPPELVVYCMESTAVDDRPRPRAESWLAQNHPNPFNPSTTITYSVPREMEGELVIYDPAGRRVRTLLRGVLYPGTNQVTWNGTDDAGAQVASGVYLYQLRAGDYTETKRMILLK